MMRAWDVKGPQRDGGHGNYPDDFVHEFRLFHKELKEFFNASSLEERLDRLRPQLPTVQGVRTHPNTRRVPGSGLGLGLGFPWVGVRVRVSMG